MEKIKYIYKSISSISKFIESLFFDPIVLFQKWICLPFFVSNLARYIIKNRNSSFRFKLVNTHYASYNRFQPAGIADGHYFHQDLWAARLLHDLGVKEIVDVGSRVDGFIAHVLPFCRVSIVDIRPLDVQVEGLTFKKGTILDLPYVDSSVPHISCLHVIEHIGLGRYGDYIDPDGHILAARELSRVLAYKGKLLIGTPVGKERLCFDAHRIFDPQTVIDIFSSLKLESMSFIGDDGKQVISSVGIDQLRKCKYGCGLFVFTKI